MQLRGMQAQAIDHRPFFAAAVIIVIIISRIVAIRRITRNWVSQ